MKLYLLIAIYLLNKINHDARERPPKECKLEVVTSRITNRNTYAIETYTEFNAICETGRRYLVVTQKCQEEKCIYNVMDSYYNPPKIAYELENGAISLEKPLTHEFLYNSIRVVTIMAIGVLGIWTIGSYKMVKI